MWSSEQKKIKTLLKAQALTSKENCSVRLLVDIVFFLFKLIPTFQTHTELLTQTSQTTFKASTAHTMFGYPTNINFLVKKMEK